jgi:hypothetical protein
LRWSSNPTAFRDEIALVTQARIEWLLPTIDGVGVQTVGTAQLDDRRAGRPWLQDGELLPGGNAAAATVLNR